MTEDGEETLVERHDFIAADCVDMEGIAEFDVRVALDSVPDEVLDGIGIQSCVESAVENHLERYLLSKSKNMNCEARAVEVEDNYLSLSQEDETEEVEYSVWVKFG